MGCKKRRGNVEDYKKFKDNAVKQLDSYLQGLLISKEDKSLKKIKLMSYWMKEYCMYLKQEDTFKPNRLKRYERGDVIKVNLGYNVGSEEGGLHYAIVLDKKNSLNSPVITVIPLTSVKNEERPVRDQEVFLGDEIYKNISVKFESTKDNCVSELKRDAESFALLHERIFELRSKINFSEFEYSKAASKNAKAKIEREVEGITEELLVCLSKLEELEKQMADAEKSMDLLKKLERELNGMKKGSIALIGQITTISKQRIYDPKNINHVLSGIKLSPSNLDKINQKLKDLYVYE